MKNRFLTAGALVAVAPQVRGTTYSECLSGDYVGMRDISYGTYDNSWALTIPTDHECTLYSEGSAYTSYESSFSDISVTYIRSLYDEATDDCVYESTTYTLPWYGSAIHTRNSPFPATDESVCAYRFKIRNSSTTAVYTIAFYTSGAYEALATVLIGAAAALLVF